MSIRDEVRQLEAYRFRAQPAGVKLDQNEFPSDLPAALKAHAIERAAGVEFHRYPEIHAQSLREAIGRAEGWDPAGVVVANGSNVLIQAVVIAAAVGKRVLTVRPTFSVYGLQAHLLAGSLTEVPLAADFSLPTDRLLHELEQGGGVVFLANPAAPTGNRHDDQRVAEVVRAADPARWLVVLDEAYWQFAGRNHSALVGRHPHVLSLRTLSKAFGLGGVRIGYALGDPAVAGQLQKVLLPFSVSALQIAVGQAVLERAEFVDERVRLLTSERDRVATELARLEGVQPFPSVTNFILFRVSDADAVHAALAAAGVSIRKQHGAPGLEGCLRVGLGLPHENDRFLQVMQTVMAEKEMHV